MNDRNKTALILGGLSLTMFSPLAMSLLWRPIPLFQNLGFERDSIAPPLAWILATIIAIAYVLYTMKAIPLVLAKQKEISLFKLLGILSALVGGIVEEVFFRRWTMDMLMSSGVAPIFQVIISGLVFGLAHTSWTLLAKRDFKVTLPAIISTSILGVFLAIIYLAGGRNLGPCIFAHVLINVVIEPWLMLSAVSGMWRAKQAVADPPNNQVPPAPKKYLVSASAEDFTEDANITKQVEVKTGDVFTVALDSNTTTGFSGTEQAKIAEGNILKHKVRE